MKRISKIRELQVQFERHVYLTISRSSYKKYTRALETFLKKFPEKRGPRDYYSTDIEDFKILRLREGKTPNYVGYELSVVRSFFQWMKDYHEGLIEYNPASEVRVGRTERAPLMVRPPEIYKTIYHSIETEREGAILLFAVLTGLGPKDIARVERSDIDFDRAMLLRPREIPLRGDVLELLRGFPPGRLFFKRTAPSTTLKKAVQRAGYQDIRFPDLQRFFATTLLRHGVSMDTVEQLSGMKVHRRPALYSGPSSESEIRAAMEHLPRLRGRDEPQ